ncbi:shikimate dehydrogenase [Thioclava sp. 'Guangxiensis']|uniref:shikimate dehydrogenase n=1 Tax=Thioclava sp. 'Guangxiensis' TaxID=3149044 RepID=UPI00387822B0
MSHKKIPLAGVIGHPISHSLSPALHGYWLRQYGLAGHYVPMDVAPEDLEPVLRGLHKAGFVGCNITIPHKEAALALADEVTERARLIGSANTLVLGADGRIHADNTDGFGFIANLKQSAPEWEPGAGPAAVLGAGGASRAIIVSLLEAGAPEIRLCNRTRARAEALAEAFGPKVKVYDWADAASIFDRVATAINTTSLGMAGQPPFDISLDLLPATALAADIVYVPLVTAFLQKAQARGCKIVDGLGMLLHQGRPGFERWFGQTPEVTDALRAEVLGK